MKRPSWLRFYWLVCLVFSGVVRAATFQLVSPTMEVWENAGAVSVVVWRDQGAGETASVEYVTRDQTAVAAQDYGGTNGVLTFAPEDWYRVIQVPVINNSRVDGLRTFGIQLRNPSGGTLAASGTNTTVTVVDDDRGFDCPVREMSVGEACRWVWVPVIRQGDAGPAAAVGYSTWDDSARAGEDYVATNGVLHFAAGETEKFIGVSVLNDGFAESQEAFLVRLEALDGGTPVVEGATARVRIEDNDQAVALVASSTWVREDAGLVVLSVIRNDDGAGQVSMDFATVDQTAKAGEDYVATSGTLVFAPGELRKEITVQVLNDGVAEPGEMLQVVLSDFVGLSGNGQSGATLYIEDNDPGVFFESTYAYAGESDAEVILRVTRRDDAPGPITVSYTTVDGDARAGLDFVGTNGVLTFESSGVSRQVRVRLINDLRREDSEAFKVMLRKESGPLPAGWVAEATVVVADNDTGIMVDGGGWVSEADGFATLGIRCQEDVPGPVTVDFATVDGTALAGLDYVATNGTVTLRGGERRVISVPILNDALTEGYESFRFEIGHPSDGMDLGWPTGVDVTIADNDTGVAFVQADLYVNESDGVAVLRVQRHDDGGTSLRLGFATQDGTAVAGADYLPRSGALTLAPGEVQEIEVPLVNDLEKEAGERFTVVLTNATAEPVPGLPATATVNLGPSDPGLEFTWVDRSVWETDGQVTLAVTRGQDAGQACSVEFRTEDGTALAGKDYVATNGTLNFRAGEREKSIRVVVVDDGEGEPEESFYVRLLNPSVGSALGDNARGLVRIAASANQEDSRVQWESGWSESVEGVGTVSLCLVRSGDLRRGAAVDYWTVDGTAVGGQDYVPAHETVVFLPGEASQTVTLQLLEDDLAEAGETLRIQLGNPTPGLEIDGEGRASLYVLDDDQGIYWDSSYIWVQENASQAVLTVRKQSDYAGPVTVHYATVDGTARAGADFVGTNGILVFQPGAVSGEVRVAILNDGLREADESFGVVLWTEEGGAHVSENAKVTVQIQDNDPGVAFAGGAWVTEDTAEVRLTLQRHDDLPGPVTAQYATVDGTARAGSDYVATSGAVTFGVGQTQASIVVPILNDAEFEPGESFSVRLTGVDGAGSIGVPGSVDITVQDNDPGVRFMETWAEVREDAGKVSLTLVREDDRAGALTVRVITQDATAVAGSDYGAVDEVITLDGRGSSRVVEVPILNDGVGEGAEEFRVRLVEAQGGWVAEGGGVVTVRITDNDPGLSMDSAYYYVSEGAGLLRVLVMVQTDAPGPFAVDYSTVGGTAVAGADFVSTNGTLVFEAGVHEREILVPILNDGVREPTETFRVQLSNWSGAIDLSGPAEALVSIEDNDPGVRFSQGWMDVSEGQGRAYLRVLREDDGPEPVTVRVSTQDGYAIAGEDYVAVDRVVTLAARGSEQVVEVPILNDGVAEGYEDFTAELTEARGGVIAEGGGQAQVRITDNDLGVLFDPTYLYVPEEAGTARVGVRVQVDLLGPFTVDYTTVAGTAKAGEDFVTTHGTLMFETGAELREIQIPVLNDGLRENQEYFRVRLSNPSGGLGIAGAGETLVTITDNDTGILLSSLMSTVYEGSEALSVMVQRVDDMPGPATVRLSTRDGTAMAGEDYGAVDRVITLPARGSQAEVRVPLINDGVKEPDETFTVELSGAQGSTVDPSHATMQVTIRDNDLGMSFEAWSVGAREGQGELRLLVRRQDDNPGPTRVDYQTQDGTALAGRHYTATNGTLVFEPGEHSKALSVMILNDATNEPQKQFRVQLLNPVGGWLSAPDGMTVLIEDNDEVHLQVGGRVDEGAGVTQVNVRRGDPEGTLAVDLFTSDGTALAGLDYVATNVTVRFAEGEVRKQVAIGILNDGLREGEEWFEIGLSNVVGGAALSYPTVGVVSIQDNDSAPSLQQTRFDERAGATNLVVLRGNDGPTPERIAYAVAGGTAARGVDYVLADGVVELAPGASVAPIPFTILQDPWVEPTETVVIDLRSELTGATNTMVLEIGDDESPLVQDGAFRPQQANVGSVFAWLAHPDGRLVVSSPSASGGSWVGRLMPDGNQDPSFQVFQTNLVVTLLGMQSNSRVLCGTTNRLFRLSTDGTWDSSFAADLGGARLVRFAVLPGDRIGVVLQDAQQPDEMSVRLCEPDGGWAHDFAPTRLSVDLNSGWGEGAVVSSLQSQGGGILIAGRIRAVDGDETLRGLVRLGGAGGADRTFRSALVSDSGAVLVQAITVDEAGRILVALGSWNSDGENQSRVVRLLPDGTADGSFQCDDLGNRKLLCLALEPGGAVWAGVGSSGGMSQGLVRLGADGPLDRNTQPYSEVSPAEQIHMLPGGMAYVSAGLGWDYSNGCVYRSIHRVFLHPEAVVGVELTGPTQVEALEDAGSMSWIVRRLGDTSGELAVRYATQDETATGGLDYEVALGTLVFGPGEHAKTVTVRLLDDGGLESTETFWLGLEAVTPGAHVGADSVGYGVIRDNEVAASQDHAYGGSPDPYTIYTMVMQADGRVVAAVALGRGENGLEQAVVRFDAQGRLDPTFQRFHVDGTPVHLALMPEGRILVGFWQRTTNDARTNLLVRLLPDGRIDPGFASVTVDSRIAGLAVDAQSRIWLTRGGAEPNSDERWLERLLLGGEPDGSFPPVNLGPGTEAAAILHAPGGAVAVKGRSSLVRLTDSGTEDAGFHQPVFGGAADVALISELLGTLDGMVIVRGYFSAVDGVPAAGLARLRADGTVDVEFTRNSAALIDSIPPVMGMDHLGRLLVSRYTYGAYVVQEQILRLGSDGRVDPGFRPVTVSRGPQGAGLSTLLADKDDNVVAGGSFTVVEGEPWAALARFYERTPGSAIELSRVELSEAEHARVARVRVIRRGNVEAGAWVHWRTGGGTATDGADFLGCEGVVEFGPLETEKTFEVPLVDDVVEEPEEWFSVMLTDSGGSALGGAVRGWVWIADNDTFGSIDLSVATPYGPLAGVENAEVTGMALQPGGKLLVWGRLRTNAVAADWVSWAVHRLNPDGSRDWGFSAPQGIDWVVGVRRDGRVVAVVEDALVLLGHDGALESVFLEQGASAGRKGMVDLQDRTYFLRHEETDRGWEQRLERYTAAGAPDPSFATEGLSTSDAVEQLVSLKDGRVLLVGRFAVDGEAGLACCLRVVNADGTADDRFAGGWFSDDSYVSAVAECRDGALLVGGLFGLPGHPGAVTTVLRFGRDGVVDPAFGGGDGATSSYDSYSRIATVVPLWDGRIVVAGQFASYDGVACSGLVLLNPVGGGATALGGEGGLWHRGSRTLDWRSGTFLAAAVDGGRLWLGGWFNQFAGQDQALLVRLAITPPLGFEGLEILPDGYFRFGLGVQQGHTYVLEGSEDLRTWTPMSTNTAATDRIWFHDLDAPENQRMFFRATRR